MMRSEQDIGRGGRKHGEGIHEDERRHALTLIAVLEK